MKNGKLVGCLFYFSMLHLIIIMHCTDPYATYYMKNAGYQHKYLFILK